MASGSNSKTPSCKRKQPAVRLLTPPDTNKKVKRPPRSKQSGPTQDVKSSTARTGTSSLPESVLNYSIPASSKGNHTADENDVNMGYELKANIGAKLSQKTLGKLATFRYHGEGPSEMPLPELSRDRPDVVAPGKDLYAKLCESSSLNAYGREILLRKDSSDGDLCREALAMDSIKNSVGLAVKDNEEYQDNRFGKEEEFLLLSHQPSEIPGNGKEQASSEARYISQQSIPISIHEDDRVAFQESGDDFPFDDEEALEELLQHRAVQKTAPGPSALQSSGSDSQTLREVRNPTLACSRHSRIKY